MVPPYMRKDCGAVRFAAVWLLARSKIVSPGTCMTEVCPAYGLISVVDQRILDVMNPLECYPSIGMLVRSFNRRLFRLAKAVCLRFEMMHSVPEDYRGKVAYSCTSCCSGILRRDAAAGFRKFRFS